MAEKDTESFSVRCEKPFKVLSHALKTAKAVLSRLGKAGTEKESDKHAPM